MAIRRGPWNLICFKRRGKNETAETQKKGSRRELYNLGDDLGETRDLAGERPEIVRELEALMQKLIADGRSTPGPAQPVRARVWLDSGGSSRKRP